MIPGVVISNGLPYYATLGAAKLATKYSFHLVLKGIPDTAMKRPCSEVSYSRQTFNFFRPTIQCLGQ
jgi:hypothetical protein